METNNKKEPTPGQPKDRKKLLIYPLMVFGFLLAIYFIFNLNGKKEEKTDEVQGFNAEVPQAENEGIVSDKKTAYELEQQKKKQEEKIKSLQDYAFSLGNEEETEEGHNELDLKIEETENKPAHTRQNSIESSNAAYRNITKELNSFYEPTKDNKEKKQLEEKIEELTKQLEDKQNKADNDPVALMEKSYQMAAKYLTPPSGNQPPQAETSVSPVVPTGGGKTAITAVSGVRENIVSRLDQPLTDSAFLSECLKNRNRFNTAEHSNGEPTRNTINACVYQTKTLCFGNGEDQKVCFRILEDVQAGTLVIPRNSLFTGDAKLQGGRLEITITTIEYAGNIIPVKLTVYDLDGQKGIEAPGSMETDAIKEAAGNMGAELGTSITLTQDAKQQIATDLAKGAIQTGAQYLGKKIKTVKVTLKANHEVFILPEK